jgi:hypothetical protein
MDSKENASKNSSTIACLFVATVTFLLSRCLATTRDKHELTGEINEVCRWDGLRCQDVHTKFHKKSSSAIQKFIAYFYISK